MVTLSVDLRLTVGEFNLAAAFEAPSGITALFGPSGAGKTLTLRSIAGLTSPDAGRVTLSGRVLLDTETGIDLPARDRDVGYVFQQYALFPHLSVEQNVAFGIQYLNREERSARVRNLLQLVGLEGYGKRKPGQLSGGQQQRVALARALSPRPALLLLDEPFASVDQKVRRRLRDELRRLHDATGTPMLLVTHDLGDVRQLADFVVLLDDGSVVQRGRTAELLGEPMDPAMRALVEG